MYRQSLAWASIPRYVSRVCELVRDWCRLTNTPTSTVDQLERLIESAEASPRLVHAGAPRLCADGWPVEVCERLTGRVLGPSITCECAPFDQPSTNRLQTAVRRAMHVVDGMPGAAMSVRAIADALFDDAPERANPAIWIGAESDEAGRAHSKVYFSIDGRRVEDIAFRCEHALERVLRDGASRARSLIDFFGSHGYVRMLALSFGPEGFAGAKLYARLKLVDLDALRALNDVAGVPFAPFDLYVRRVLRQQRTWFDARAGVGVALDDSGSVAGAALYHYPHGYFSCDEQLRTRLLDLSAEFAWDPAGYRPTSRLLDARDGSRVRSLLAFGVSSKHGTVLHAYGRTGHLAA